jgi:hypothetical protein
LKNGRTGFRTWDALERRTAATQIGYAEPLEQR